MTKVFSPARIRKVFSGLVIAAAFVLVVGASTALSLRPLNAQNSQSSGTSPDTGFNASMPNPPFTDFRFEKPGNSHKITVKDLPSPVVDETAIPAPKTVARPENVMPQAPAGFKVDLYATGLNSPRFMRTAPNGDLFVAEGRNEVGVLRGVTADGKAEKVEVFADTFNQPYGIAFYPPGPNPRWIYVGNTDSIVRFPYVNGDIKPRGPAEHIADLAHGEGRFARSIEFSRNGKKMFVGVGSATNVDDTDTTPSEKNRGVILEFNPDGSGMRTYAYGIRSPGGGIALDPKTGVLWCSVGERDGLGDNLVPDYITHVVDGGFYGWPWWYMGGQQDPRHSGKHPELQKKVITPDVLLQPHNATLSLTFYEGKQFPSQYAGDIFASQHGTPNKTSRVGYEVIRIPRHQSGKAKGEYEDFLTGFILANGSPWGRPVGVAVGRDGSLMVSDDGSNSIWRVSYVGR